MPRFCCFKREPAGARGLRSPPLARRTGKPRGKALGAERGFSFFVFFPPSIPEPALGRGGRERRGREGGVWSRGAAPLAHPPSARRGGRPAAAEDAEGRRRGPDPARAAGRAPPEGVGRAGARRAGEARSGRSRSALPRSLPPPAAAAGEGGGGGGGWGSDMAADLNLEWVCSLPRSWTYGITRGGRVFFIK